MLAIADPSELKPADVYRQARMVSSKTSRGRDRNWYRDPFEIPWQWHLWFDGGREVCSACFSRLDHVWRPGPSVPLASLTTGDGVGDLLGEVLTAACFGKRPKALGVILHVADEFSLAEVVHAPDASGDAADDFKMLRYNLIDDPREVLADREVSVETTSWRLLPFWGAAPGQARCTAMALSRSREAFLRKLLDFGEEARVPIRVAVTAAALESLAALPLIEPALKGGRLIVVGYLKFTAVFAISPAGELRGVRSLAHRGGALVPASLGDILWSMAVSAELAGGGTTPSVLLVSADPAALAAASKDLEAYSSSRQAIQRETLNLSSHPALLGIPGRRPEFLVCNPGVVETAKGGTCPLAKTVTFPALWSEWITQSSFFDTAKLDFVYPTLQDLRLLKLSTLFIFVLVLAIIGSGAYGAWSLFTAMDHPSWNLTPMQVKRTEDALVKLQVERHQIEVATRLLWPRSRGWVTLEFLMQLFPEDSGVRLESYTYGMDASRPGPSKVKGKPAESTGLVRTWSFRGQAKPQAIEVLSNLNSQRGLNAFFERAAKSIGEEGYAPGPTRQMTMALTQGRNPKFDAQSGPEQVSRDPSISFPFTFEAIITQTMTDKDPLALPTEKPF